jgi:hypothetical protein
LALLDRWCLFGPNALGLPQVPARLDKAVSLLVAISVNGEG